MNIGRETETIEFKKSTSELKEALQSMSAILNKHQHGVIYFGVKDNGEVVGQEIGKDTLRDISNKIRDQIKPECFYNVEKKNDDENNTFIEVSFNGERVPYSANDKFYLRFSNQNRLMTNNELRSFFLNIQKNYSIWEKEDSLTSINDIDETLLEKMINKGYENKRLPFKYTNSYDVLKKLGLIAKGNQNLNNAGNVLFSSLNPITLKLATFATETKETFLKLEYFEGNIFTCIEKGISYVLNAINWNVTLDGSPLRKETPEIPKEALREIIVNAFSHARYRSSTTFEIDVFKDRVTIYSPGYFPLGYTPEDFAYNHEEPIMLNPKIIHVLFKTCQIESFGYGFETTFKLCKEFSVPYKYENTKSGFKFIFYRPLSLKYSTFDLNNTEIKVLRQIIKNSTIKIKEIASNINKSEKTVSRALKKLKEENFIYREGDDFRGERIVNKDLYKK